MAADDIGSSSPDLVAAHHLAIDTFLSQKNFPCVPALHSLESRDYLVGIYDGEFGSGRSSQSLYRDLLFFKQWQREKNSVYSTLWAVFPELEIDETDFEARLWKEISSASSFDEPTSRWDPNFSSDPSEPNFCPSFGGDAFFIVGLHPRSSRLARKFPVPAIVFNLYEQFEQLTRMGKYETTVKANRAREMKFAGSLNPMVEQHGDKWEAIQFSGKNNPPDWKCPFHRASTSQSKSQ